MAGYKPGLGHALLHERFSGGSESPLSATRPSRRRSESSFIFHS